MASIDCGDSVRIINESHGSTRIVVGAEQVMLTAPRLNGRAGFEQIIAEKVCTSMTPILETPRKNESAPVREDLKARRSLVRAVHLDMPVLTV